MTTERITGKIRKLLALAEGSEGSEAEAAAKMADRLMREHAVSLHNLREDQLLHEDPMEVTAIEVGKSTWAVTLAGHWVHTVTCRSYALPDTQTGTHGPKRKTTRGTSGARSHWRTVTSRTLKYGSTSTR